MNTATETGTDAFAVWDTLTLAGITFRVTPQHEYDNWIATVDDREWRITDGEAWAYDGNRDEETGQSIVAARMPAGELREYVIEQLDHYGVTLSDVNRMKS
jgi:hypothetical protein